jgi:hypothetical protein
MNPRSFVAAAMRGDDLTVRQTVKDVARASFSWAEAPAPDFPWKRARAVYAVLVEFLALRAGQLPPAWTADVAPAPAPVFLVRSAKKSRAMRRESLANTPDVMKSRNVFALPQYLALA